MRATEAYKFFFPGVAFSAGFFALESVGVYPNRGAGVMQGSPKQIIFTPNSDTPYASRRWICKWGRWSLSFRRCTNLRC